jgi:hypothetical protein
MPASQAGRQEFDPPRPLQNAARFLIVSAVNLTDSLRSQSLIKSLIGSPNAIGAFVSRALTMVVTPTPPPNTTPPARPNTPLSEWRERTDYGEWAELYRRLDRMITKLIHSGEPCRPRQHPPPEAVSVRIANRPSHPRLRWRYAARKSATAPAEDGCHGCAIEEKSAAPN